MVTASADKNHEITQCFVKKTNAQIARVFEASIIARDGKAEKQMRFPAQAAKPLR